MRNVLKTIELIESRAKRFKIPSVTEISQAKDPYLVLISCILSLRTKDRVTIEASRRLFKVADTAGRMARLPVLCLEKLIFPVGFYHNKARVIKEASLRIIQDFGGRVPDNLEDLLTIRGVGRKTANLVLGLGYNIPSLCVDTHVHRIPNRLGWIKTKNPEQSEEALKKIIPRDYWIKLNTILVSFGQNICLPLSPLCSKCPVSRYCKRTGVNKFR